MVGKIDSDDSKKMNMYSYVNKSGLLLRIEAWNTFEEVQLEFNKVFPYLKIENMVHQVASSNGGIKSITTNKKLSQLQKVQGDFFIEIYEETTVAELVQQLTALFNLPTKVLRKSNNLWIETTLTDNWTLVKQNMAGKQFNAI
ncbi:hypothetical protein [Limnovirga soli]|uniref:Uncharacterized protein n=1 Tax=Limnovirga soli TaxID=2656915 RepID=A0A8J8FF65_9BACT|nr:hypothetical protein [Limnovirga soli]NNV55688.1 hypothetical protein [Limnovirga soli]